MRYISTRDDRPSTAKECFSFEQAICSGYAPDGGLFIPEQLPEVTSDVLKEWSQISSYPDFSYHVMRMFIDETEISNHDLRRIVDRAFTNWGDDEEEEDGDYKQEKNKEKHVPIRRVGSFHVTELFHGPTFCFKDFGIRFVVQVLSYFATLRRKNITILVATTGDTGPASLQAVLDCNNPFLTILVYYPQGQISNFQRKQLTTSNASDVARVITFEGGGDDMDRPIKNILNQQNTNSNHLITGINSYNIGRPLFQMVYHTWTYLRIMEDLNIEPGNPDYPIDVVLPTGAMGNIVGGTIAKCMGVPIRKLCPGVNINDITYRIIHTGKMNANPKMYKTLSEALNVQLPYNFERILFYLSKGNHKLVKTFMERLESEKQSDLSVQDPQLFQELKRTYPCERVTDEELCSTISYLTTNHNYVADPHTAVAFCAANKLGYSLSRQHEPQPTKDDHGNHNCTTNDPSIIVALLATASPCKFQEAITQALGPEGWDSYYCAEELFPPKGKRILQKQEYDPIIFRYEVAEEAESNNNNNNNNATLEQVQMEWEKKSVKLINDLQQQQTLSS